MNITSLFHILLLKPEEIRARYENHVEGLRRTQAAIEEIVLRLGRAEMAIPDAGLVRGEFTWVANMLHHACLRGIWAVELAEIDGRQAAFTGDLIAAPGKIWSLSATQWTYTGAEGAATSILSLLDLKERRPDAFLPSHGEVIAEPGPAIDLLVERLWQLLRERRQNQSLLQLREQPYRAISPHLLQHCASSTKTYVVLSDSGRALMIDFGYDFAAGLTPGANRASRRPWLYTEYTLTLHPLPGHTFYAVAIEFEVDGCRALGLHTLGLTGQAAGAMNLLCDVVIRAPGGRTPDVQEYHIAIYHTPCAMLEEEFFG